MKKSVLSLMLILTLVISAVGIIPASADTSLSSEKQLEIIMDNVSLWNCNDSYSVYSYAITDLDGNGRLEVFAAITEGTGIYTYGKLFEVTAQGSLKEITLLGRDGDSLPEVIVSSAEVYSDPSNGRRYYIFTDSLRNGIAESYESRYGFSLYMGRVLLEHICGKKTTQNSSGSTVNEYYGADNASISEQQFNSAVGNYYRGYQRSTASFGWFQFRDGDFSEIVHKSWNTFSSGVGGTVTQGSSTGGITITLPAVSSGSSAASGNQYVNGNTVTVYENPQAAANAGKPLDDIPTGSNGGIYITKNPTAESLTVGGKNWFIAHASGATSMKWQLIDTNNRVYSTDEAVNVNPGLRIDTNTKDTLEISNVPASLNGWSARAVFSNGDVSCATVPAAIYVGDFVTLYGSVINAYKTAYQNGRTSSLEDIWNLGISEYVGYSSSVGYGMKDLDKDGIPELIIAGMGANDQSDKVVFDVYTLQNNVPVNLCNSRVRDSFRLREDSSLYERGSGGAAIAYYSISKLRNGSLVQLEAVRSDLDENNNTVWYFSSNGGSESKISENAAQAKIKAYEATVYLPFLTKIA
ncbi:MAG: hypothetical protein Q4F31_06440 [Eubacteriales bacterium]|nr:hypothetical protein [Eubacteriales bacterium]